MSKMNAGLLEDVRALARRAGEIVMDVYATDFGVRGKQDASPVTLADERAEEAIVAALRELTPDVPIIAEEAVAAGRVPEVHDRFWLVDPLDGTKEFISRNGEFTVNIAEIVEGKPVRGVVHAPAIERLFFGEMLSGAYEAFAPPGGKPDFGEAKRIQARAVPKDGMTAVASRSHRDANTDKYLADFKVKEFISAGSSLKLCLVATGEADIYPRTGRTMEWDIAAGHAVLAAAGGSVKQLDGQPFHYGKAERGYDNPFFVARGQD